MTTRPTYIAQTSKEVKKQHKKNGNAIPEWQQRQLERGAALDQRAARIREQEQRKKAAKKKREEKERKEREAREQSGMGLATQLVGYSHTQAQLKRGMEAFLGVTKKTREERVEEERQKQLDAVALEVSKEPWDDDDAVEEVFELPDIGAVDSDQWIDDDLDDDTLLEAHDSVMSDPVEECIETPLVPQLPPSPSPVAPPPKDSPSKEAVEFVRLHGPVNKVIESILDQLPEPLIELLSQDSSTSPTIWDPAHSLLHKLNPTGLPPHRLRIKVGCVANLLRDLNTSSPLSRSQYVRILQVGKERLECLVLDGQLEGTKAVLTRVTFAARHRNDASFPFQRIQYPIQVSKDFDPARLVRIFAVQDCIKLYKVAHRPLSTSALNKRPSNNLNTRSLPTSKLKPTPNPNPKPNSSFKLPGLPASKARNPSFDSPVLLLDDLDDFLDTGTQIARDLSSPPPKPKSLSPQPTMPLASISQVLPPLSTQDFDFSLEDLDDSPKLAARESTKYLGSPTTSHPIANKYTGPHDKTTPLYPQQPESARKSVPAPPIPPPPKRVVAQPTPMLAMKEDELTMGSMGFRDFGLSTQEVVSFFDDDDDVLLGSPPIAV